MFQTNSNKNFKETVEETVEETAEETCLNGLLEWHAIDVMLIWIRNTIIFVGRGFIVFFLLYSFCFIDTTNYMMIVPDQGR